MAAPEFASRHAEILAALGREVAEIAREQWSNVDRRDIGGSWLTLLPRLLLALIGAQKTAAAQAEPFMAEAAALAGLSELALGTIKVAGFAGTAADGRSLLSLLFQPVIDTLDAIGKGKTTDEAMAMGAAKLEMICRNEISDAGRTADQVAMITRADMGGYIRVVVGDTCSRCLILAGRWYPISEWFERHPLCDCVQLPAAQAEAAGLVQDPREIYEGLTGKQRTEAGWTANEQAAIDEGADIIAVTNARRGVYTAGGKQYTTEGTSRRGLFGGYDIDPETSKLRKRPRSAPRKRIRLTPEQIFKDAKGDRDEAIRLLRVNGYLLEAQPRRAETPDNRETQAPQPEPALVDPEEAARDRQARIDVLRSRAEVLASVEQQIFDEADGDEIARNVRALMKRLGLGEDSAMAALADGDFDDPQALAVLIKALADESGLGRIGGDRIVRVQGTFGISTIERGLFKRSEHNSIEGPLREGTLVDIVKPGYTADIDGQQVQLFKADVSESDDAEVLFESPLITQFHESMRGIEDLAEMAKAARGADRTRLAGGQSADVELVQIDDNRLIVHKRGRDWGDPDEVAASIRAQADGEQMAALLAGAIDARVARVYRDEIDAVWMEYIRHDGTDPSTLLSTAAAIRLGLLDVLSVNGDRNEGNLLADDGLVGIDQVFAYAQHLMDGGIDRPQLHGENRPTQHFVDANRQWKPNPLHPDDIPVLRERIQVLKPAFKRIGRGDWHAYTLRVLDRIATFASGTERLYG